MKRYSTIAAVLAISTLLLGCGKKSGDEPKPEPTPLFKPGLSYWNFEHARREYGYKQWETIEDRRPLVSDKRPPFELLVIRVRNYQDNGFSGDLVLWFYNNRLMKTQFYVQNIKEYLNAAALDQQISLGNEGAGGIAPHTRVWKGKDADGKTYIGMEDEILKQKMDDWIVRYSQAG